MRKKVLKIISGLVIICAGAATFGIITEVGLNFEDLMIMLRAMSVILGIVAVAAGIILILDAIMDI